MWLLLRSSTVGRVERLTCIRHLLLQLLFNSNIEESHDPKWTGQTTNDVSFLIEPPLFHLPPTAQLASSNSSILPRFSPFLILSHIFLAAQALHFRTIITKSFRSHTDGVLFTEISALSETLMFLTQATYTEL